MEKKRRMLTVCRKFSEWFLDYHELYKDKCHSKRSLEDKKLPGPNRLCQGQYCWTCRLLKQTQNNGDSKLVKLSNQVLFFTIEYRGVLLQCGLALLRLAKCRFINMADQHGLLETNGRNQPLERKLYLTFKQVLLPSWWFRATYTLIKSLESSRDSISFLQSGCITLEEHHLQSLRNIPSKLQWFDDKKGAVL